jgi:hypothetical protein
MSKDGHSTAVTKIGVENYFAYSLGPVKDVGSFAVEAAGSGTYTEGADALEDAGEDLCVRANTNINPDTDLVVTVTGTKEGGGAVSGVATILKASPVGQAFEVVVAGEEKFATVTGVTVVGGAEGDGFDIAALPTSFTDLDFIETAEFNTGRTTKAIPKHYEPTDHTKRIRGENTLTMRGLYQRSKTGLSAIAEREVTIRDEIHDDGQATATEVWIYSKCRVGAPKNVGANDENVTVNATGTFGKAFIFS